MHADDLVDVRDLVSRIRQENGMFKHTSPAISTKIWVTVHDRIWVFVMRPVLRVWAQFRKVYDGK